MPTVEFVTGSAGDGVNYAASSERLLNTYAVPVQGGTKSQYSLQSVPGAQKWSDIDGVFLRSMESIFGTLYAVAGGRFYSFYDNGTANDLGAVEDGAETSITSVYGTPVVASGGELYTYASDTLTKIEATLFADTGGKVGSVASIKGRAIITELDGPRFQWSDVADPGTFGGLNFANAESVDDDIIRAVVVNDIVLLMGVKSIEGWYSTGQDEFDAFRPLSGLVHEVGLKAFGLVAKYRGGAFFVGSDGAAYMTNGSSLSVVSTPAVERAIAEGNPTNCFYYEYRGQKWCVIRFSDRPAAVYDMSSGLWHERGTGDRAWTSVAAAKNGDHWYTGGNGGDVFRIAGTNDDEGGALLREMVSKTLYNAGRDFRVAKVEVLGRVGIEAKETSQIRALVNAEGEAITNSAGQWLGVEDSVRTGEPVIRVSFSKDGGATWGKERTIGIGKLGETYKRLSLRSLGQFAQLTMRIRATDDVNIELLSAVNVELA